MDEHPEEADEAWPLPFGRLQPEGGACARCGRAALLTHLLVSVRRVSQSSLIKGPVCADCACEVGVAPPP